MSATMLSKIGVFESTFSSTSENEKEFALTKIKIIFATNSSSTDLSAWIKNVGMRPIKDPSSVDLYFGRLDSMTRIPFEGASPPRWNYSQTQIVWEVKETVQIDITLDSALEKDVTYMARLATPNGVKDDHIFSIP